MIPDHVPVPTCTVTDETVLPIDETEYTSRGIPSARCHLLPDDDDDDAAVVGRVMIAGGRRCQCASYLYVVVSITSARSEELATEETSDTDGC